MDSRPHKRCAICSGPLGASLLLITQPDRFERHCGISPDNYRREWMRCDSCGAVTNILPQQSERKLSALRSAYYEVDFVSGTIGDKYRKVRALPPERSDNAGRVARILDVLRVRLPGLKRPKVLDIGAGTGVFLSRFLELAEPEWEAVAVEPDPNAAKHLRTLARFLVIQDVYKGQEYLSGFNLVTLNKIVEHIPDPVSFLAQIAGALSEASGILYLEVPDALTIRHRARDDNILGALHCHLYDPMSLGCLLRRCGLEILDIQRLHEPSGKLTVFGFACRPAMLSELAAAGPRETAHGG